MVYITEMFPLKDLGLAMRIALCFGRKILGTLQLGKRKKHVDEWTIKQKN